MILGVTTKVRWLSKNSPRCAGQRKSPDFNSQRAVSQIAPPDAFPRGRHRNSNARARVKFLVDARSGATSSPITSEIVAIASEQAHGLGVAARNDAEAVVLDLVNPAWPFWRLLG
jgi:hypothetical protein